MNEPQLRGVLYGHGRMGQFHAAKIADRSDIELSVIDPGEGLLGPPDLRPDFAIIATPTTTHAKVAGPLLHQGIPCLIEKPLASNIEDATRLAEYSNLYVGHIERFNPVFSALGELDSEYIEIERLSTFSDRANDVDVIDDLMIHDLDLISQMMPGPIIDIRAKGIGVMSSQPDIVNARIEVDLGGERVGVVNLTASRISPRSIRTWRVVEPGRYWSLDLKNHEAKMVNWADQEMTTHAVSIPKTDALTAEHDAFFCAIRQSAPFPCTGSEALEALQLAERIRSCLL